MQDMNRDIKLLKVKGIKEDVIKERIAIRRSKIGKMKKVVWPVNIFIFLVHLLTLSISDLAKLSNYAGAIGLLIINVLLIIVITWMKGAGTIDDNNRMSRSPWM